MHVNCGDLSAFNPTDSPPEGDGRVHQPLFPVPLNNGGDPRRDSQPLVSVYPFEARQAHGVFAWFERNGITRQAAQAFASLFVLCEAVF
jgi:hypothetical protein